MTATTTRRPPADDPDEDVPRRGWTKRRIAVVAVVTVLVIAAGVWAVAFSSLLGIRDVDVRGEHALSEQTVRAGADLQDGTPLVRVDTDAVTARVEAIAGVYSAEVSTSFPSTVLITVVERMAVGAIDANGNFVLVDRTGAQFRTLDNRPPHLPLFVVPTGPDARSTGRAVATVAAALPGALRARVASIQALDPGAITLLLTTGRVVRWGSAERTAEKARILPVLLRENGDQFDVTDPSRPFSR